MGAERREEYSSKTGHAQSEIDIPENISEKAEKNERIFEIAFSGNIEPDFDVISKEEKICIEPGQIIEKISTGGYTNKDSFTQSVKDLELSEDSSTNMDYVY